METALHIVGPAHSTTHVNRSQPALTENTCAGNLTNTNHNSPTQLQLAYLIQRLGPTGMSDFSLGEKVLTRKIWGESCMVYDFLLIGGW